MQKIAWGFAQFCRCSAGWPVLELLPAWQPPSELLWEVCFSLWRSQLGHLGDSRAGCDQLSSAVFTLQHSRAFAKTGLDPLGLSWIHGVALLSTSECKQTCKYWDFAWCSQVSWKHERRLYISQRAREIERERVKINTRDARKNAVLMPRFCLRVNFDGFWWILHVAGGRSLP